MGTRKIFLQEAGGLSYQHEKYHVPIIHTDIRTSNILLDRELQQKIANFGLIRLLPEDTTHLSTKFSGTFYHLNIFAIICRTIAVHFTNPFHVSTRVADKCSDGTLLLQVILHSQVKANLTIHDSWLDLKDGFTLAGESQNEAKDMNPDSDTILNIKYKISGDRNHGSHTPMFEDESSQMLTFKSALVLQRPVLEPCLAVGFLPLPLEGLRVGQLFTMKWRVERLKYLEDEQYDEVVYEINANSENWMIAGRKRGHAPLSTKQGSRIEISILCVPLVAGCFGVVVLEIISGKRYKDVDYQLVTQNLLDHAQDLHESGVHLNLMDEKLDPSEYAVEHVVEIIKIALMCTQPPSTRPTTSEVVICF
uniref:Protein kinase domain-containing protein n=1 Tax=Lactuca sativa TaxID=4236 RepID=A0A9R1XBV2_LACSA|nr:hypothetical protein LSAT_V11C500246050 [Lactuca sativa]